jgi:hypothetical protein
VTRSSEGRRNRLPLVLVTAACLVAGTAAASGASTGGPALRFAGVGRWFADSRDDRIFHVDGMSRSVDALVTLHDVEPGTEVVEGQHSSYVIDADQMRQLDKATLAVTATTASPAAERPVTVDTAGEPYAVFRRSGKVARLDSPGKVIEVGGPLGMPVMTPDGTLWLHRVAAGLLCQLTPDADRPTCAVTVLPGHTGALSVLDTSAVFLDFTDDTMTTLTLDGPGAVTTAGVDLPASALVATRSVRDRIAVVAGGQLLLLDAHGLAGQVTLPPGRWAAPLAGRSSIVLLDQDRKRIHTYDPEGRPQKITPLPAAIGEPRLSQGQDGRVYVQGASGREVLVVDDEGRAETVTTGSSASVVAGSSAPALTRPSTTPPGTSSSTTPALLPPPPGSPTDTTNTTSLSRPNPPVTRRTDPRPGGPGPTGTTTEPGVPPPITGRPGIPPGLAAIPRSTELVVTWGAAPANGAEINTYEVSWAADDGRHTTVVAGDDLTATIGGLRRGTPYRISVAARNRNGLGEAAALDATMPTRWITVSRGEDTTYDHGCEHPSCAFVRVDLFGFPPNTEVDVEPMASEWRDFNPGARLSTEADGTMSVRHHFPFNGVGQTVWVDIGDTQSNRFLWPERGPA